MGVFLFAIGLAVSRLGASAISSAAQSDPAITLTLPAMPVSEAVKQFSQAAYRSFVASPETAKDIVTWRFDGGRVSDAMARIAGVLDATWKQDGDTFRLIRTPAQLRDERSRELAADIERISASVKKLETSQAKLPRWSADMAETLASRAQNLSDEAKTKPAEAEWYKRASALTDEEPIMRAVAKVASMVSAKELAELPLFYKVVWSSNPTSMQRPIPGEILSELNQFWIDQTGWVQAVTKHGLDAPGSPWTVGQSIPKNGTQASPGNS